MRPLRTLLLCILPCDASIQNYWENQLPLARFRFAGSSRSGRLVNDWSTFRLVAGSTSWVQSRRRLANRQKPHHRVPPARSANPQRMGHAADIPRGVVSKTLTLQQRLLNRAVSYTPRFMNVAKGSVCVAVCRVSKVLPRESKRNRPGIRRC